MINYKSINKVIQNLNSNFKGLKILTHKSNYKSKH